VIVIEGYRVDDYLDPLLVLLAGKNKKAGDDEVNGPWRIMR
jgi:hypothetical protein